MAAAMLLGALATPWALAQGVYRIVGPDGRVSYSDQPPPPSANAKPVAGVSAGASGGAQLPSELRQVVGRYPVTLYTGSDCTPCNNGRNMLNARGIPYTEKTVNSADDGTAFKRLSNTNSLPLLTIGSQQVKGYSESEWNQYLDAAGYPKQSVLPASYRRPAATALVEAKTLPAAPPPKETTGTRPAAPVDTPAAPTVEGSGGIRF
ncbi:NrdH-redoxin [Hydrogenophaga sp. A37]|nr:NrdH-redoxin [Hydrogenophaga sp. A37]